MLILRGVFLTTFKNNTYSASSIIRLGKKRKGPKLFQFLAGILVLAFFLAAYIHPPKVNPKSANRGAPECEVYPITIERDITGVIYFPEPERITSVTYAIYEKTLERLLFEEEVPMEMIERGSYTIPQMSFWDDYVVNFTDYTGFETKGDYKQQVRVSVHYRSADDVIRVRTYTADPVEAELCWMQQASRKHGSSLLKEGYITEIIHSYHMGNRLRDCYVGQSERVRKDDVISVNIYIDGKPANSGADSEKVSVGLNVLRIPIPKGMEQDGTHTIEIYMTHYVLELRKALDFYIKDTF